MGEKPDLRPTFGAPKGGKRTAKSIRSQGEGGTPVPIFI